MIWHHGGQVSLSGPLLTLYAEADQAFAALATHWNAAPERHPVSVPVDVLARSGYLRSFPHQVNFVAPDGAAEQVLTPAACYHLYPAHEGETLTGPLYLTTVNTCFRREKEYIPLRRQWSFTMREVVCIGTPDEVTNFLDRAQELAGVLCELAGIPVTWEHATDPFYRRDDPGFLLQKITQVKQEATYSNPQRGDLAIASVNKHYDHFGETFNITRATPHAGTPHAGDGEPAHSGCLAFGIERWLAAITEHHGDDPANWPDLPALARKLVAAPHPQVTTPAPQVTTPAPQVTPPSEAP
jgi:hypothetical protein